MRKTFYFVRHGQTILNAQNIRQGADGSLSDKGFEQANITGRRLEKTKFDIILASPYERAKETAETIAQYVKKPIVYLDLLVERRNPKEIVGRSATDLDVRKIVDTIDKSFHDNNFRFSDEENFSDLKTRAREALKVLSKRREKRILVVTHSIFLKILVAYIVKGEELSASDYNTLSFLNTSGNASITVCEYRKGIFVPRREKGWKLIAWDDEYK